MNTLPQNDTSAPRPIGGAQDHSRAHGRGPALPSTGAEERWRESVHEAGHGLMAVLLGRSLEYIRIEPNAETKLLSPTTLPKRRVTDATERAHLEGEAMLALAGVCAERVVGVASQRSLVASRSDLTIATAIAKITAGSARAERAVAHHIAVVERMLTRRKAKLLELAEALRERHSLSGDEVRALVPRM